jgi:hypothetical protein
MAVLRVDIRLPWTTTLVRGPLSSNTYHVDVGGATVTEGVCEYIATQFLGLYQGDTPAMFSAICDGTLEWAVRNLDDPIPRLPVAIGTSTVEVDTTGLPGEVAITLGFKAARESGVKAQRYRGRVSLGPLSVPTLTSTGSLTTAVLDQVEEAVGNVVAGLGGPYVWVVGGKDDLYKPIETFTISNECGTVRRRQLPATAVRTVTA